MQEQNEAKYKMDINWGASTLIASYYRFHPVEMVQRLRERENQTKLDSTIHEIRDHPLGKRTFSWINLMDD